ncbi:MAG: thiamine-phosphate kinase [Bacteroidales bacterium]|nr:thiamine-phosphate kinase [Bacteroidales bacterium]
MSRLGEFELIERISAAFNGGEGVKAGPGVTGIGDDCAILPQSSGLDTLVTTDLLVEGRHFLLDDVSAEQLGWKSAAVNISDIAAMGGRPVASFLSLALPASLGPEWVERFIGGFKELSARFGVPLLGGDTSASPDNLFINVTLLGECRHGAAVRRDGARPGDLVCVTGTLGDSAAGLRLLLERNSRRPGDSLCDSAAGIALIDRHYCPMPRVAEGQALAAVPGLHAMMDISDGIASDLRHILRASAGPGNGEFGPKTVVRGSAGPGNGEFGPETCCGTSLCAEVDLRLLPESDELRQICDKRGWDPAELAVSGGEDYELLFTLSPEAFEAAAAAVRAASGGKVGVTAIGKILTAGGTQLGRTQGDIRWLGGAKDEYQGFTHF